MADMFLWLEGIKGESMDASHRDEIEIDEWVWGLGNDASFSLNPKDAVKHAAFDSILIDKKYDIASVTLMNFCAQGKRITKGELTCRKNTGSDRPEVGSGEITKSDYLVIALKDIQVNSIKWPGKCEPPALAEQIKLTFSEFTMTYLPQREDGGAGGGVEFGFNSLSHTVVHEKNA